MEPKPRYVVYISKTNLIDIQTLPEFKLLRSAQDYFDPEQDNYFAELELTDMAKEVSYVPTVQDIMDITSAKCIHEEATNAFFIDEFYLADIYDLYNWDSGLGMFLGQMLSVADKLLLISKEMKSTWGQTFALGDCKIRKDKETTLPLPGNIDLLFGEEAYSIETPKGDISLWWAPILSKYGLKCYVYTDAEMLGFNNSSDNDYHDQVKRFHDIKDNYDMYDDYDEYWNYRERRGWD